MVDTKLSALVNALPEFYQPIYGHSEWDDKPLRSCKDRAIIIEKIYDDLSKELGRPLRVDSGTSRRRLSCAGKSFVRPLDCCARDRFKIFYMPERYFIIRLLDKVARLFRGVAKQISGGV